MHVWGEGGWTNHPVWGNAVGRGIEPVGGDTNPLVTTTRSHSLWKNEEAVRLLVLTRFVRLWWGHR